MKFGLVLVVHDPLDRFAQPIALPETIASIEALHGDRSLIISVNRPSQCPATTAMLHAWASPRDWVTVIEHEQITGAAASFNAAVGDHLDDCDVWVFTSSDALFVDRYVLMTLGAVFDRWPHIGAAHPMSTFEDADFANSSPLCDHATFLRFLHSPMATAEVNDRVDDPVTEVIATIAAEVRAHPFGVGKARRVLPLTAQALRTSMLREIGLFDDRWEAGYENMDMALRAYRACYASVMVHSGFVYHRRLLFRALGSYSAGVFPSEERADRTAHGRTLWLDKWGTSPEQCWDTARRGAVVAGALTPVRRVVERARRAMLTRRIRAS